MPTHKQKKSIELEKDDLLRVIKEISICPTLYVIRCNNFYKIGHTSQLERRIDSLQTSNPYLLEPVFFYRTKKYKDLEEKLHVKFKHKRKIREWFELSNEDLVELESFVLSN